MKVRSGVTNVNEILSKLQSGFRDDAIKLVAATGSRIQSSSAAPTKADRKPEPRAPGPRPDVEEYTFGVPESWSGKMSNSPPVCMFYNDPSTLGA